MIQVTYDAKHCRLTLRGHAGSGQYGNDAVCAAASILTYTLADRLAALEEAGRIGHCTAHLEPGYARIHCRDRTPAVRSLFKTVVHGFRLLCAACPGQVQINNA